MGIQDKLETSDELHTLTGKTKLSRPQAMKEVWKHIKELCEKNSSGSWVCTDPELKAVVGKKTFKAPDVMKAVSKHLN